MIIMAYMMCFQDYYQKETERMINKAIDNELEFLIRMVEMLMIWLERLFLEHLYKIYHKII